MYLHWQLCRGPSLSSQAQLFCVQARFLACAPQFPRLCHDRSHFSISMPSFRSLPAGKDYGKRRTKYPDFAMTDTGLQYQDLREGSGREIQKGDRVTVDWDGYTIGECSGSAVC